MTIALSTAATGGRPEIALPNFQHRQLSGTPVAVPFVPTSPGLGHADPRLSTSSTLLPESRQKFSVDSTSGTTPPPLHVYATPWPWSEGKGTMSPPGISLSRISDLIANQVPNQAHRRISTSPIGPRRSGAAYSSRPLLRPSHLESNGTSLNPRLSNPPLASAPIGRSRVAGRFPHSFQPNTSYFLIKRARPYCPTFLHLLG